ncbi:TonB-dependent receptor domain-containing protein [Bacteroides helcogenes]|nr:TonB-dependent receptor [Bacteroides helcogenes]
MKKMILSLTLCLCTILVQAVAGVLPDNVKGTILEKTTNTPVEFANVGIYQATTDKFITGTVSNAKGCFSIQGLSQGNYYIQFSYIGYEKQKTAPFTIKNNRNIINLGKLYLIPSAQQLDEVVVKGKKSTYVQSIDKKVFNVGQDLMSASGSASDLMQNIPSVQVDVEGNISLRGNENVEILINGKPSTLMNARTRADVLQQLPANDIERVEIITNPSAQYKPDGVSGIINIVMKKQRTAGFNGNATANIGSQGRANAGTSLNYNTGRVNLFATYGIRYDHRDRTTTDNRTQNDGSLSYISQPTNSRARPLSHIVRAGMDWNINNSNTLQLSGGYNRRTFLRTEDITATTQDETHNVLAQSIRYRHDNEKTKQAEAGAVYTHTFGEGHLLTIDYNYSLMEGLEDNKYKTFSLSGPETRDNTQIWQAYYQHLIRATYSRTLSSHLKLNLGYEADLLKTDLNFYVQNSEGNAFVPDLQKTSDFTNRQNNQAIYATLEYKQDKLGMLLGIRPEYMMIKSQLFTLDSVVTNNYFMVYPTLHTSYKLDERNELQLNYSLRVNRPDGEDMNPFPEYQNPLSLKAGNPYLKPEKIHSIEAGYQWQNGGTTLLGTLYYHYVTNKLTTVTKYLNNSILLTTKENLNSSSSAGLELIMNTHIGKWATINLSGNGFYNQINAEKLGYGKNKNDLAWSASLNANFNLLEGWMLQLNSRYISSSLLPQGKREGTFITNVGMKYEIPRTRLSLMATISDVFNTFKKVYTIDTPQLKQRVEQRRDPRIFYIGAVWSFGSTPKKAKQNLNYDESL